MDRYTDRERYFRELAETSEAWYVDYLGKYTALGPGCRILEVGCGEGGNLLPFASRGCRVAGIDLSEKKIANARSFFGKYGAEGDFFCENFLSGSALDGQKFDIILIHDVIEHIEPQDKPKFFRRLRDFLEPDGIIFFAFPAWQMPFGGHQQICKSKVCSHLPFVHLLPASLYEAYLRFFGEDVSCIKELASIKRSRMTIEAFESLCRDNGYRIADRVLWLINPHYKAKFNLPPTKLCKTLGNIPLLRNFLSTSCFYILTPLYEIA